MDVTTIEDDRAARCHANCIEYAREGARRSLSSGEICERDGVVLIATGSDFAIIANVAFRLDPAVPAEDVIRAADSWFGERGRGWSLGTTSWSGIDEDLRSAAEANGLIATTDMPGMICDQRLPDGPMPDGLEVRILETEQEAADFISMCDLAYTSLGVPAGMFHAMAAPPLRTPPPHETTVGVFEDGVLLSGAQVMFSNGIAGVYAVGTAEAARGRGLAALATRCVTNLAFDHGAPYVTLQASPMGESIYLRLGYRELYRYVNHTRFAC